MDVRLTPRTGSPFVYPADWTVVDATHLNPTPIAHIFASLPAGGSAIASFTITEHEVDLMEKWEAGGAHPWLLGVVTADNDYAFVSAPGGPNLVTARNNLAERALTVVPARERREERDEEGRDDDDPSSGDDPDERAKVHACTPFSRGLLGGDSQAPSSA